MVIFLEIRIKFFSFPYLRFKSRCKNIEKNSLNKAFKVVLFCNCYENNKEKIRAKRIIIFFVKSKILSDFFDKNLPKWMSFKFIMEAKKIS